MYYHLILTDNCNLCCSYCRGKAFECLEGEDEFGEIDCALPVELNIDLDLLYSFLARDPEAALTFYGGEPLLRRDLIEEIMQHAPVSRFLLHTNGVLLDRLKSELVANLDTILVSIDGPKPLTDLHRGEGTYNRVISALSGLSAAGFKGELIGRMTVDEQTDIYAAVRGLAENTDYPFTSLHWQLDANYSHDFQNRDFVHWVESSYNPGISRLVEYWVSVMREQERVLRWYPFLDTMEDLLLGRTSRLRCGSGYANYTILTDGSIVPCPVMIGMKQYYLGHIATTDPGSLKQVTIGGHCRDCSITGFCGGRCLYSNIIAPWPEEGRAMVCETIHHLHASLTAALPEVRELISEGHIALTDFCHSKFNGCEIIP